VGIVTVVEFDEVVAWPATSSAHVVDEPVLDANS
jgi:hypothetical protein